MLPVEIFEIEKTIREFNRETADRLQGILQDPSATMSDVYALAKQLHESGDSSLMRELAWRYDRCRQLELQLEVVK